MALIGAWNKTKTLGTEEEFLLSYDCLPEGQVWDLEWLRKNSMGCGSLERSIYLFYRCYATAVNFRPPAVDQWIPRVMAYHLCLPITITLSAYYVRLATMGSFDSGDARFPQQLSQLVVDQWLHASCFSGSCGKCHSSDIGWTLKNLSFARDCSRFLRIKPLLLLPLDCSSPLHPDACISVNLFESMIPHIRLLNHSSCIIEFILCQLSSCLTR